VVPKSQGGGTSFINCVISCQICNNKKSNRTPEEAGMLLIKKPTHPSFTSYYYISDPQEYWHEEWDNFLGTY
jgi:5-methylcytosine-specific restriction endonuclease McrA